MLAALPLVLPPTHADYSHLSWTISEKFFPAFFGQWVFGDWLRRKWNEEVAVLAWARLPMLLLSLALGWIVFVYGRQLGGEWAGLLGLTVCQHAGFSYFWTAGTHRHPRYFLFAVHDLEVR